MQYNVVSLIISECPDVSKTHDLQRPFFLLTKTLIRLVVTNKELKPSTEKVRSKNDTILRHKIACFRTEKQAGTDGSNHPT